MDIAHAELDMPAPKVKAAKARRPPEKTARDLPGPWRGQSPGQLRAAETDKTVADNLRILRLKNGLTLHALAELVGFTVASVQQHEKCATRISVGQLKCYADALRVPIDAFYAPVDPVAKREASVDLRLDRAARGE